tara:strand:- start:10963 stop:11247 length:285 start_codon:yes stop_codon:yes gene_type:complete
MKTKYLFYITMTITLLSYDISFSQQINDNRDMGLSPNKIVQKLNTPTKIWINGGWEFRNDGTRFWKKGHWEFEEKTFQKKSEIFREKLNAKNRV